MVFEQLAGDLVGIGVEEAHPAEVFDLREPLEQQREAVLQAEVFAVAGGVLADERDFAHALLRRGAAASAMTDSKRRRAELAAQLRDDAEAAGMIAAFGDLDVGGVLAAWPARAACSRRRDSSADRRRRRPTRHARSVRHCSRAAPSDDRLHRDLSDWLARGRVQDDERRVG